MKSKAPLKTYKQRRKAHATISARIESMEHMIREITLKQDYRHAHDLAAVRSAIEAVEEVSIGFVCYRQKSSSSFTSVARR